MRRLHLLVAVFSRCACSVYNGEWVSQPDMDVERYGTAVAVVESKLYVCGGTSGGDYLDTVEVYDSSAGTWSTGESMPTSRRWESTPVFCISSAR